MHRKKNNINRTKTGILYIIRYNQENNGHIYLPEGKLVESAQALLSTTNKNVIEALEDLSNEEEIVRCELLGKKVVYPKNLYDDERFIVKKLDELASYGTVIEDTTFAEIFKEFFLVKIAKIGIGFV